MTRDTTVTLSKYCSRSPFSPFLPLNITTETEVSCWYYSLCSSIASFGHCPYWLRLVTRAIPSDSHNFFLSHFPPTYMAVHYLSVSTSMFPDILLTRRTTVSRLKYFLSLRASRYISSSSRRTPVSLWFLLWVLCCFVIRILFAFLQKLYIYNTYGGYTC